MTVLRTWFHRLFREKEDPPADVWSLDSAPRPESMNSFAEDHNDTSLAMYRMFLQKNDNLFFSPFSIRNALGMAFCGARGETATQMQEALRFPPLDEKRDIAMAGIVQRLKRVGGQNSQITLANSLWGQDGEPVQQGFLDMVARQYGGEIFLVDFRAKPEAARVAINRWTEDRTKEKIRDLIPYGGLGNDTRLVLINAVHFLGEWAHKFRKRLTHDQYFHLEDGGKVKVPLMIQKNRFRYIHASGFQAVDLGYRGGGLSMLVLLPDKRDGLGDLESRISSRMLSNCVEKMQMNEVQLLLPRFKMTWGTVDLSSKLAALGMPLAFTPFKADFSGINGYEPPRVESLHISSIFHQAYVDVSEEGTEAAAATGGGMVMGLPREKPPPAVFFADHPFLFAIRDQTSGAILFLGRVADPTREK
jgi:serpin B